MNRSVSSYVKEWNRALYIEMEYLKKHGGDPITLLMGTLLSHGNYEYIYQFQLPFELFLPDGANVRIVYQTGEVKGQIISIEESIIYIKTSIALEGEWNQVQLYHEPWELLQALMDRLEEIKDVRQKIGRLKRIMTGDTPVKHDHMEVKNELHEAILRAYYNSVTYIWGPPGTGKTYTLAKIISSFHRNRKKVLVLSYSNSAVDLLMLEVAKNVMEKNRWKQGSVVRYGYSRNEHVQAFDGLWSERLVEQEHPDLFQKRQELEREKSYVARSQLSRLKKLDQQLSKVNALIKEAEIDILQGATIIGTTLSKAIIDKNIYEKPFDLVVVDEISMAYTPQVAFAATLAKRVVVCGDFKQLPPIAASDHAYVNESLKRDLFYQTKIAQLVAKSTLHPHLFILKKQRRMHQDISAFTNQFVYEQKVSDHSSVQTRQVIAAFQPFAGEANVMLNTAKLKAYAFKDITTDSRYNLISLLLSLSLLLRADKSGVSTIGFVTPYKAQARLMNSLVKELLPDKVIQAATVHKFQGSECDMILFDLVDSAPQSRPGKLLTDETGDKLLNVAITRARGKLITIADQNFLQKRLPKEKLLTKFIQFNQKKNQLYEPEKYLSQLIQNKKLVWYKANDEKQMMHDLQHVKKSILLCVPLVREISHTFWEQIQQQKNIEIKIITAEPDKVNCQHATVIPSSFPLSMMILDEKVLWLNIPYTPANIAARLHAPCSIEILMSYLDLNPDESLVQKKREFRMESSLTKFLHVWERCPDCNHTREPEITKHGKVRLICHYCGNTGGITRHVLQKFLDYADVKCVPCQKPLEAISNNGVYAQCQTCDEQFPPKLFLSRINGK